ncbi:phosphatidate cytidylyltransferase [Brachybacterium sp. UMB0905]|nr:phosphatidate cytidylyltransferase [Brachybacterium sp. UMB0905]
MSPAASSTASSPLEAVDAMPTSDPGRAPRRRGPGRNLPAAIAVGLGLLALLLASLFVLPQAFPVVAAIAMVLAVLELVRALSFGGLAVPAVPLLVGVVGMVVSTVVLAEPGLLLSTAVAVCVLILWRISESMGLSALRDVAGGVFTLTWIPFLGSFLLLLMQRDDGPLLVLLAILGPIGNDVGGYIAGVLLGKHPMAPSISPKKSWEGFAGSLLLGITLVASVATLALGMPWWAGVAIGVMLVLVSTCGDLAESLLKRDLGIKDMGHLLPGHGGVMDRVDSILLAAPATYLMLEVLLP